MEHFNVRPESFQLLPGDILVLYTDGITEAFDPKSDEQFGSERLAEIIRQNEFLSAEELTNKIRQVLNEFTEGNLLEDDVTLVVSKVI
jgi:sigma-B regulation protein RsbU (phosphoserine phosphatase)